MSSIEELEISINQYELQLSQVNDAIKSCSNDGEKSSLENLKCDLQELLELTQATLKEQVQPAAAMDANEDDGIDDDENSGYNDDHDDDADEYVRKGLNASTSSDDPFATEMALLMSEIKSCESNSTMENSATISSQLKRMEKVRTELTELVGKKCSAPYKFAWGARDYHNALVCGIDTDSDTSDLELIRVKVLFTNPIHRNMIPCPFYLDGECRFDSEKCRFSHGECVQYTDLKEYKQPNFSLLSHIKHPVLTKLSDNIWYKGRVVTSNFNEKTCQIRLDHNKQEITCNFADLLPIEEEKPFIASSDSEEDSSDENEVQQQNHANLIQQSLMTPSADQALGEWEKHTKGFGSRMLNKMGYVIGTGLGQNGEGIIVPVSAQILPPGRSLDHCMELREHANGDKDLFSVERKLKRLKKKTEAMCAKAYEREKQNVDVFSFINQTVFTNAPSTSKITEATKPKQSNFKNHTTKSLNVENLKIGEDIRRKEREIEKLKASLQRHKHGTPVAQQLSAQLDARNSELKHLRKTEVHVKKEQSLRKDKVKLTVF